MTEKIWKPVRGYEGRYRVSNEGDVEQLFKSKYGDPGKLISASPSKSGYYRLSLNSGVRRKTLFLHVIVLEAFTHVRPKGMVINHKDGNPSNNHIDNLEWVTTRQNIQHAMTTLNHKFCGKRRLTPKIVKEIRSLYAVGNTSYQKIADKYNVHANTIRAAVTRLTWEDVT